jgi:gliding motility-associated protein GldM
MAIKKRRISPRQKMINLMYVVLMAMLALNVSTEVLNGFSIVEESLDRTTSNSAKQNNAMYSDFDSQMQANPAKVKEWFMRARQVKQMSDSLYNFAQQLKVAIVKEADGKNGDIKNIENKEDLEASTQVMLAPGRGKGRALFNAINSFRERILSMVTDGEQKRIIESNLSTKVPRRANTLGKNWQEYMFENMPVAAAVTLLSKLQSDVRYAEGEVLHTLISNVDIKDIRVNQLSAFVIPNSQTIVRGDKFSARIVMAAIDTTKTPDIYIGNRKIDLRNGLYETVCGRTGEFTLAGYLEMMNGRGEKIRRDFSQKYTVVDPSATVSADIMNVLYAGYSNPISISVPGVPLNKITATMSGGSLTPVGPGKYIAHPTSIGHDAVITVSSLNTGHAQQMGQFPFHVRKLPDPTAYIDFKDASGTPSRYKGGALSKGLLMGVHGIGAAIDDGLLNIEFRVVGFETVFFDNMGNAVPQISTGSEFSEKQREIFRKLSRGRRFYISRVRAVGPDGIERRLPASMEVIVN